MIDSSDKERLDECKCELSWLLTDDNLKDCVFLIMANKQDLPNALSVDEIRDQLQLHKVKDRTCCMYHISMPWGHVIYYIYTYCLLRVVLETITKLIFSCSVDSCSGHMCKNESWFV